MTIDLKLGKPLITAEAIGRRVGELAADINGAYRESGRPLSVVVVLKGAAFFAIDLLRHLTVDTRVDFLQASSYVGTGTTGEVRLVSDITMGIAGTDVLLVEDIVDTGLTARWLLGHLASHQASSVRLCTLLDKPSRRRYPVAIDFLGFKIPDAFVVGYGLDYEERYRNLPAIHVAEAVPLGEPTVGEAGEP
jgi:hypoxanthine phosphoribosyltransferase